MSILLFQSSEWQMCSTLASSFLTDQKDALYYFLKKLIQSFFFIFKLFPQLKNAKTLGI